MLRFKAGYMIATGFSHSSIYNLAHGPGLYKLQRQALQRMPEWGDLLLVARSPDRHRAMAQL